MVGGTETAGISDSAVRFPDGHVDFLRNLLPAALGLARMLMGVLWLFSLRWKLPPDFTSDDHTSLREWLELEVEHAAFGFYGDLIENLALPNFTLFAWLVFLAELLVGLSLLFGFKARAGAAVGFLMSLNLAIGLLEVPGEWPWSYLMMAMWHGTLFLAGAGWFFGLDGFLSRRRPDHTSHEQEIT